MKIALLLLLSVSTWCYSQGTYTASIRVEDLEWYQYVDNSPEWKVKLYADLFLDSNLVNPNGQMHYAWYSDEAGHGMQPWGPDLSSQAGDGAAGLFYHYYVVISGPGILAQSSTVTVGLDGSPKQVFIATSVAYGSSIPDTVFDHWAAPHWLQRESSGYLMLTSGDYSYVRINPSFFSTNSQRFNFWNSATDVFNHAQEYIYPSLTTLTAHFTTTGNGVALKTAIAGSSVDSIDFKDPWLADFTEQPYGVRNQGTNAPFKRYVSQYTPGAGGGVFLNQSGPSTWNPPYYSIRTPGVKNINGSTAFFVGWSYTSINIRDNGLNADGYFYADLEFLSSSATVTANYSYSTVSLNNRIPSGTWPMVGTVTVASGVTLAVNSGATLNFPQSTGLTVNGALSANGATLTSSGIWNGITLNANGSSLTNCTISSASCPLTINNVSNATISGCTINNSAFGNSQAVLVSASTPSITSLTIAGGGSSSNGVRYTSASGGTLSVSEIHHLGAGSAVVIQGGSHPTLSSNNLHDNYYNGIYAINNGSPMVYANANNIRYNTSHGGNSYSNAIVSTNSHIDATNNLVHYVNWGFTAYNSGSVTGGTFEQAGNTATDCNYGMVIYNGSQISFGHYDAKPPGTWTQACNNFYYNTYNASATVNSGVWAQGDYWGVPGQAVLISYDGSSWVSALYPLSGIGACYGSGGMQALAPASDDATSSSELAQARSAMAASDLASAKSHYIKAVSTGTLDQRRSAFKELYLLLRDNNDPTIDEVIQECAKSAIDLQDLGNQLLLQSYIVAGHYEDARNLGAAISSQYPDQPQERDALVQVSSLMGFDTSYSTVSTNAVLRLQQAFASSVDPAFFAVFGVPASVSMKSAPSKSQEKKLLNDSTSASFGLASYPNPFNPTTQIEFTLDRSGPVSLKIYDELGREVMTLVDEAKGPGKYTATWNGGSFASGVYYARLEASGRVAIQKLLLMK